MVMDSDEALVDQIAADKSFTAEDIDEMDLSSGLDEKGNKNNYPYSIIVKLGSRSISNLNLKTQKRTRADVIIQLHPPPPTTFQHQYKGQKTMRLVI